MRPHDAREIRAGILAARADAKTMVSIEARNMKLVIVGELRGQAYLRTLDKLAGWLWRNWIYATCTRLRKGRYEFEYELCEMNIKQTVYRSGFPA